MMPERPTQDTDPSDCKWCYEENFGAKPCPYHGERPLPVDLDMYRAIAEKPEIRP